MKKKNLTMRSYRSYIQDAKVYKMHSFFLHEIGINLLIFSINNFIKL